MNNAIGSLLNNRYRITSVLGQGGMGAVYKAIDENLDVPVAVKENLFLTEEYTRQFQREANILASLRHSSLPGVRDYFTLPGIGQYLVMDFIEGEDLRQRIERTTTLPENEVAMIGAHICDALSHLHSRMPPVVHRDIKPGNIKITPNGGVVLVDFGLAKVMQDGQVTTTGARAMTPGYSPPEQYGTARTDARSDIYSLGATLYAALTGVIPEDGLTRATGKTHLTPIRQLRGKVNRKLATVIERALEIDPDDRYQTADEFKTELLEACDLTQIFQEPKTIAPPPEGGEWEGPDRPPARMPTAEEVRAKVQASRPHRRRRRGSAQIAIIALGALALVALIAVLASSLNNLPAAAGPGETITSGAATFDASPTGPAAPSPTSPALAANPTIAPPTPFPVVIPETPTVTPTPAGGGYAQIAFASNRTGNYQIWIMDADGNRQNQITNEPGGACQPTWSPDGKQIAFISPCPGRKLSYPGSNIYIMSLTDKNATLLPMPASPMGDFDPTWSPDGDRIAFTSLRNGRAHLFVYDMKDALLTEISNTVFPDMQPAWSPTGKQLAFIRQVPNGQVWLMGDDGGLPAQFSPSGGINNLYPTWARDAQMIYYSQTSVDQINPWLVSLKYEDRNTAREFRIPASGDVNIGPVVKVDISPDGQWIAYEGWPDGVNHDIFIMSLIGAKTRRLTSDRDFDFGPVWRPAPPTTP